MFQVFYLQMITKYGTRRSVHKSLQLVVGTVFYKSLQMISSKTSTTSDMEHVVGMHGPRKKEMWKAECRITLRYVEKSKKVVFSMLVV